MGSSDTFSVRLLPQCITEAVEKEMKLTGSVVFLGVVVGAYGAVLNSHQQNQDEDWAKIHYRIWGENPWDYPGNPPPIFPPEDFWRYSQIGRWWNQERPWENPARPWRAAFADSKDDSANKYRLWGKFPWERPGNPPPFVPPADMMPFSQIGHSWSQDENSERPERLLNMFLSEKKEEHLYQKSTQDINEVRQKLVPLYPPTEWKLTRVARFISNNKPWEKPWNPPPFLPDRYPPLQ
ncbi:uncharacterized protein LOC119177773 isoform X2 [Rhipicephalus microplus]|uniref:uncharacterized protein LOC119177773 isoform X2 n=1 Tax=Rhipicephalus microplus TaxID=6941 RepID=UPI003F6BEBA3